MSVKPIKVKDWLAYLTEHPNFTGCLIDKDNDKVWYKDGKLHREDGPAFEYVDGSTFWYLNGECHRTDGPALELASGSKSWWINGKLHRENGPAFEYANGSKEWYLNGAELSKQEHRLKVRQMKMKLLDTIQHSL
jgi:hypothetical protein